MDKKKIIIGIGFVLSCIVIGIAAHTTIFICDETSLEYNVDICRPHIDNELVIWTFLLDYFLLIALVFISFIIINTKLQKF